jgi:hypothetical protein
MCGIIERDCSQSTMPPPLDLHAGFFSDGKWLTIPDLIERSIKNSNYAKCNIDWDGGVVHYFIPDFFNTKDILSRMDSPFPTGQKELFSLGEAILKGMSNNSKGEECIGILSKLYNVTPEYPQPLDGRVNDAWITASNIYQDWIKSYTNKGKPTLLIDELDDHLDIDNQVNYWQYIGKLTDRWQVIVVSHSLFAFKQKDVNYINLNPEYFNKVKKLMNNEKPKYVKPVYVKCHDRFDIELKAGDTVDVQLAGKRKIYLKGGQLWFKPYGVMERVSSYFSNDLEKIR